MVGDRTRARTRGRRGGKKGRRGKGTQGADASAGTAADAKVKVENGSGGKTKLSRATQVAMARNSLVADSEKKVKEAKEVCVEVPEALVGALIRYTARKPVGEGDDDGDVVEVKVTVKSGSGSDADGEGDGGAGSGGGSGGGRKRKNTSVMGLVVGYRMNRGKAWHKIYVIDDKRTEDNPMNVFVLCLSDLPDWEVLQWIAWKNKKKHPNLGRRVVVMWNAKYLQKKDKEIQKRLNVKKIPYEAFVVRVGRPQNSEEMMMVHEDEDNVLKRQRQLKLYYTIEDDYVWFDPENEDEVWDFPYPCTTHMGELPIMTWSRYGNEQGEEEVEKEEQADVEVGVKVEADAEEAGEKKLPHPKPGERIVIDMRDVNTDGSAGAGAAKGASGGGGDGTVYPDEKEEVIEEEMEAANVSGSDGAVGGSASATPLKKRKTTTSSA